MIELGILAIVAGVGALASADRRRYARQMAEYHDRQARADGLLARVDAINERTVPRNDRNRS